MGKLLIGLIIIIIILGAFFYFQKTDSSKNISDNQITEEDQLVQNINQPNSNIIEFTDSGYSPSTLTIKKGDTVTFINKQNSLTWPASAIHPTHTVYPRSDIKKCGTLEESQIFDASKALEKGQS